MKLKSNNFSKWLESLTLDERENKKISLFIEEKQKFEKLSNNEFLFIYVNTKAEYEHKKTIFSFFLATILLSVVVGMWKASYEILLKAMEMYYKEVSPDLAYVVSMIIIMIFSIVCITVVLVFSLYLRSIFKVHKKLVLLEEIKRKRVQM